MRTVGGRLRVRRGIFAAALLGAALVAPALGAGSDIGFQGPPSGPVGSELTMSKPQSKLWFTSRGWWADMLDATSRHYHLFRLDRTTETWVDSGVQADPLSSTRADVLWDANAGKLYVASHKLSAAAETTHQPDIPNPTPSSRPPELWRFSYDAAANTYVPDPGFPVKIGDYDVEALVIAKDSTGRLWATWTVGDRIWVNHTITSDTDWGAPYVIPGPGTTLTPDDISSIIAFGGDKIGVMWSNQVDGHFYFAVHRDGGGDGPADWNITTVPYSQFSDDHINLKADSAGQVYAVVKSGATSPDAPAVSLLVRNTSGGWSEHTVWRVRDNPTRPTMLLDEQQHVVHVFATGPLPDDPANIDGMVWTKTASTDSLSFPEGNGTPFMRDVTAGGEVHDATSTKQNVDRNSGIVVAGYDEIAQRYWFSDSLAGSPSHGADSGAGGDTGAGSGGSTGSGGAGGGVSPEPVPPAPPPPPQRAILRDLVVARAQRGFVVRGRVTLGYSDSTLRATLRGAHASASALLVRRHLRAGAERFAVRLGPRARAALAHASHEALVLRVTVTGPGGRTATATRRIVLRR